MALRQLDSTDIPRKPDKVWFDMIALDVLDAYLEQDRAAHFTIGNIVSAVLHDSRWRSYHRSVNAIADVVMDMPVMQEEYNRRGVRKRLSEHLRKSTDQYTRRSYVAYKDESGRYLWCALRYTTLSTLLICEQQEWTGARERSTKARAYRVLIDRLRQEAPDTQVDAVYDETGPIMQEILQGKMTS